MYKLLETNVFGVADVTKDEFIAAINDITFIQSQMATDFNNMKETMNEVQTDLNSMSETINQVQTGK